MSNQPYLANGNMHDCEEFMRSLLSEMRSDQGENYDTMASLFYSVEKTQCKFANTEDGSCPTCKKFNSDKEEEFLTLKLPIPDSTVHLSTLLKTYFEAEKNMEMKCGNCCKCEANCQLSGLCKYQPGERHTTLSRTGEYIFLQLNRFGNGRRKKMTKVITEPVLEINNEQFTLASVVNHHGQNINAGHYTCIVKDGTKWMLCDDSISREEDSSKIFSGHKESYILIYKKCTPTQGSEQANEFVQTDKFVQPDDFVQDECLPTDDSVPMPEAAATDLRHNVTIPSDDPKITSYEMSQGKDTRPNDAEQVPTSQSETRMGEYESTYMQHGDPEQPSPQAQHEFQQRREDLNARTPLDLSSTPAEPETMIDERKRKKGPARGKYKSMWNSETTLFECPVSYQFSQKLISYVINFRFRLRLENVTFRVMTYQTLASILSKFIQGSNIITQIGPIIIMVATTLWELC